MKIPRIIYHSRKLTEREQLVLEYQKFLQRNRIKDRKKFPFVKWFIEHGPVRKKINEDVREYYEKPIWYSALSWLKIASETDKMYRQSLRNLISTSSN